MISNKILKMRLTKYICIVAIIFTSLPFNNCPVRATDKLHIIENVRIFDGEQVIPKGAVLFGEGKIIAVGTDVDIPNETERIDGAGKTLLPGLIDAHVHVADEQDLKQSLIFGVTSVVDMGMEIEVMTRIKTEESTGHAADMARLMSAGTLVTAPEGHGTEYFSYIPTISTPDEARAFINARIAEGSDFIKIIVDDGHTYGIDWPTLNMPTISGIIQAAHQNKKLTVVHIATLADARRVIEAGADGLAHIFSDDAYDPEFGNFVAQHHAFVIPTLTVLESLSGAFDPDALLNDPNMSPLLNADDKDRLQLRFPTATGRAAFNAAKHAVRQLRDAGVPILAGTDASNPGTAHGASLHRELELLVQAGLTPIEALASATSIPANIFHLTEQRRIQPGNHADLLLVSGDPTNDILATRNIIAIWKDGVKIDREAYRKRAFSSNQNSKNLSIANALQKKMNTTDANKSSSLSDSSGDLQQAIQFYNQKQYAAARTTLEDRIKIQPTDHIALFYLGRIDLDEGKIDDAIQQLEQAIAFDEQNADYHYWLAIASKKKMDRVSVIKKLGLAKKMRSELETAIACNPDHLDARLNLCGFYLVVPGFIGGDKIKAKEQAEELLKRDAFKGNLMMGEYYRTEKMFDEAHTSYLAALKDVRAHAEKQSEIWRIQVALNDLGRDLLNAGDTANAIKVLQQSADEFPESFTAWHYLAFAWQKNGNIDAAVSVCQKALELNPQKENWQRRMYNEMTALMAQLKEK
ncbi:tetratricopeptide repeat protein [candidate division KSB1 bacterium]|nr:tetratricopeptide repeat protein [candidate division KSB1 bacterium]